uniref:Uncharacterized protein n=1 Tax=Candidatus Kentrum sp. LFY TaxID=2126342 RepID=A0A450WWV0_9GAMM|nr:MAG: hypothetical protein BECKLFY1418C_GA0070996_10969 [Candidatus Kentron sp. LFY]
MLVGFAARILRGPESCGRFVEGVNDGVLYRNHIFPRFHCKHNSVLCKYGFYANISGGLYRDVEA